MKTLKILLISVLSALTFIACKTDDEFYNAVYLSAPDLITVDASSGNAVSFHTEFSRFLPELGQTAPLDVYATSGAESFGFAYRIQMKDSNNNWVSVLGEGDEFTSADAVYDATSLTYKSDVTIPITIAGEYRLKFEDSYIGIQSTDLISRNPSNKTLIRLTTNPVGLNSDGHYYFTIN
ncbi:hypothetical protein ABGT15_03420 [Flavobacterium enshiense]|uniref:hypothetical protein n=1 Tax=Flavobacterium enshiense TaxID=1341165 RepID=UPI00345D12FB